MAYVVPNSNIWVLRNVPLDKSYDHTIYWDKTQQGAAAQAAYFKSKAKYTFTEQTYIRLQRGVLRVPVDAEYLYDCNYLMYQNVRFNASKYFYAFIKGVEYVNENLSDITFELDVMQTWHFDYELDACFVEREHSATDELFENIVAEDLNLGDEYKVTAVEHIDMNSMMLCILANRKLAGGSSQLPPSEIVNNVLTPLRIYENIEVTEDNIADIDLILNSFNESDIVCIYEYPKLIYTPVFPDISTHGAVVPFQQIIEVDMVGTEVVPANSLVGCEINFGSTETVYTIIENTELKHNTQGELTAGTIKVYPPVVAISVPSGTTIHLAEGSSVPARVVTFLLQMNQTIDGYTPKNNKLFSSPYNKLVVSNNSGKDAEFKWEYFALDANNCAEFKVRGSIVSTPAVICYPTDYRGVTDDYDSGIIYGDFPQCCWSGDTFKAWWAQNKASFVTSGVTSVISNLVATSGAVSRLSLSDSKYAGTNKFNAIASGAINIAGTVASSVAKIQDIKNSPSQTHGQVQTDSLNLAVKRVRFTFYKSTINAQYAKIIDDYFERYGYACKQNKVPNVNVRPHWTFTKTTGCTLTGSIPADDAEAVTAIYNNGITFWKNASEVGNYSLDNRPVSGGGNNG